RPTRPAVLVRRSGPGARSRRAASPSPRHLAKPPQHGGPRRGLRPHPEETGHSACSVLPLPAGRLPTTRSFPRNGPVDSPGTLRDTTKRGTPRLDVLAYPRSSSFYASTGMAVGRVNCSTSSFAFCGSLTHSL